MPETRPGQNHSPNSSRVITLHHLPGSGGTIITALLSTCDQLFVVNEKTPNPKFPERAPRFNPNYLVSEISERYSFEFKDLSESQEFQITLQNYFLNEIRVARKLCELRGRDLLIRDWSQKDFVTDKRSDNSRLLELLKNTDSKPAFSVATIRNPIANFLSARRSGFLTNSPDLLEWDGYCAMTIRFFEYMAESTNMVARYEDIIEKPETFLSDFSEKTGLAFSTDFRGKLDRYKLSGASGRSDRVLAPRPVRDSDQKEYKILQQTMIYKEAAEKMGYKTG
ncbi:MAG: hypothetical protein AAF198_00450 [Pseudomonadota bacterium]